MDQIGPRMDQLGPGMGQIGPLMHQKELKIVFLYQKYPLFCRIFFGDHTLSVEIILNEVSLGGSPVLLSVRTIVKEWDVLCLVTFLHFHTLYHYIYRHHGLSICSSIFATAAQKSCKSKLSNLSLAQTSVVPWKWWNDFSDLTSSMDKKNLSLGVEGFLRPQWTAENRFVREFMTLIRSLIPGFNWSWFFRLDQVMMCKGDWDSKWKEHQVEGLKLVSSESNEITL